MPWGEYLVTGEFSKVLFFDSHFKFDRAIDVDAFASNVLLAEFINRSTLLIGSNDGLFKVLLDKDRIRSIRKYGRADGFNEEELYVGSSILRKNGEIVIGTADGAYAFDFSNEELTRSSAMVYITSVDWSHKGTNENDSLSGYFRVPVNPELAHDQNSITFSYEACNLTNPNNIKFHHQLDGAENEWSPISAAREVTYSNLSPGNYTFNIQAISEDKIYGNIERYRFTIKPAFWQRSSFYVIVFLVVLLVIFLIIRLLTSYRIKQHKVNEEIRTHESVRLRKQMAMDFHDEMGNKLAGMLSQASLLKMKHPDPSLVKIFDYFETNAYAIYHGTKDFIWTIDLKSNNLREIISYLHDFGYQLFERNNITFHVENDIIDSSVDKQLPDGYNRQIILIFKEAMTNSLKHSQSKNVFFSGKVAGSVFEMTFADDGVWKNGSTNGNGIRNMHQRAGKINAALVINQRENKTEVSLSFKHLTTNMNSDQFSRIVIIEDNQELRETYEQLIKGFEDFNVVSKYSNCEDAIKRISKDDPDLVLIDLSLPGMDGIEGTSRIKKLKPKVKVLVITVHDDSEHVFDALCAGAIGYITKDLTQSTLVFAIRQVLDGGAPMSPKIANMIIKSFHRNPQTPAYRQGNGCSETFGKR